MMKDLVSWLWLGSNNKTDINYFLLPSKVNALLYFCWFLMIIRGRNNEYPIWQQAGWDLQWLSNTSGSTPPVIGNTGIFNDGPVDFEIWRLCSMQSFSVSFNILSLQIYCWPNFTTRIICKILPWLQSSIFKKVQSSPASHLHAVFQAHFMEEMQGGAR